MKKQFITTLILIGLTGSAIAQKKCERLVCIKNLQTSVRAGLVTGSGLWPYGQMQVVSGFTKNKWFGGIGTGLDYYNNKRSIPVFAEISRNFKDKRKTPFIYADLGYNFSSITMNNRITSEKKDYNQKGGLYYEAGAGYKFRLARKMQWGFSLAYSHKQSRESGYEPNYNYYYLSFAPTAPLLDKVAYKYSFNRLSVKLNCWF